ncbi:MAG: LPS export ABC transporter permease LptG [Rhizobiaceae bacterium]
MGWTLSRYFFFRHLTVTTWFFVGVAALVFIIDLTELSRRMSEVPEFGTAIAVSISAMRLPMIMLQTIPFIALFAGMATLITLNRKYELVVARSAGVSAWQFLRPIAFGALVFGLVSVVIINPLAAYGFSRAETLEATLLSKELRTVSAFRTPWLRQRYDDTDTVIGAYEVTAGGQTLINAVFLQIDSNGDITQRFDASRAYLREGHWELVDVRRYRPGTVPEPMASVTVPTHLRPEIVQERLARPETIPFFELPEKIEIAKSFGLKANGFAMQLHTLVALPFLLVAMTLIAATVSIRFTRTGQSGALVFGGVAAGFLLYVISVLVKAFGSAGLVPPVIAAWVPVFLAGVIGVTILLHREDG